MSNPQGVKGERESKWWNTSLKVMKFKNEDVNIGGDIEWRKVGEECRRGIYGRTNLL